MVISIMSEEPSSAQEYLVSKPNNRRCSWWPRAGGSWARKVALEIGEEVRTIVEAVDEVPRDRGLEVEAQIHETSEVEKSGK